MGCCSGRHAFEELPEEGVDQLQGGVNVQDSYDNRLNALEEAQRAIRDFYAQKRFEFEAEPETKEEEKPHIEENVVESAVKPSVEEVVPAPMEIESEVKATSGQTSSRKRQSSRSERIRQASMDEEVKLKAVQDEMERIRQEKIKLFEEKYVLKGDDLKKSEELEKEKQEKLRIKSKMVEEEEAWRLKKREEEQKKLRLYDEEMAEKRAKEKLLLQKKIQSGKKLSPYEQQMVALYLEEGKSVMKPADSLHSSAVSEKPKEVRKLLDSAVFTDGVKNVVNVLNKIHHSKTASFSKRTLIGSAPGTAEVFDTEIRSIIEELKLKSPDKKEIVFSSTDFFSRFKEFDPKKDELMKELAASIAAHPHLELVEMFASHLEDVFLFEFASQLKHGAMKSLQAIHFESNQFSGKSMQALFESCFDVESVPRLKEIKLSNQKSIDNGAEDSALTLLKENPHIVRFTLDFRNPIDIAEFNRLLARNGSIAKREGRSSLSRTTGAKLGKKVASRLEDDDEEDKEDDNGAMALDDS